MPATVVRPSVGTNTSLLLWVAKRCSWLFTASTLSRLHPSSGHTNRRFFCGEEKASAASFFSFCKKNCLSHLFTMFSTTYCFRATGDSVSVGNGVCLPPVFRWVPHTTVKYLVALEYAEGGPPSRRTAGLRSQIYPAPSALIGVGPLCNTCSIVDDGSNNSTICLSRPLQKGLCSGGALSFEKGTKKNGGVKNDCSVIMIFPEHFQPTCWWCPLELPLSSEKYTPEI